MNKLRFKIDMFLGGFPSGIRAKIELGEKLNLWDRIRYRLLIGERFTPSTPK